MILVRNLLWNEWRYLKITSGSYVSIIEAYLSKKSHWCSLSQDHILNRSDVVWKDPDSVGPSRWSLWVIISTSKRSWFLFSISKTFLRIHIFFYCQEKNHLPPLQLNRLIYRRVSNLITSVPRGYSIVEMENSSTGCMITILRHGESLHKWVAATDTHRDYLKCNRLLPQHR